LALAALAASAAWELGCSVLLVLAECGETAAFTDSYSWLLRAVFLFTAAQLVSHILRCT